MGEGFTIWLHSLVSAKKKKIGSTYDVVESFKNLKLEKVLNQDDLKIVQVGRKPYMVAPPCRVYPTYLPFDSEHDSIISRAQRKKLRYLDMHLEKVCFVTLKLFFCCKIF